MTDQIRRASRSVCTNIAEAWRKRRYEGAFVSKLNDAEAEAAETQVWLEFSVKGNYLEAAIGREPYTTYDNILGKLVNVQCSTFNVPTFHVQTFQRPCYGLREQIRCAAMFNVPKSGL